MKMVEHVSCKLMTTCVFVLKDLKDHSAMIAAVSKIS